MTSFPLGPVTPGGCKGAQPPALSAKARRRIVVRTWFFVMEIITSKYRESIYLCSIGKYTHRIIQSPGEAIAQRQRKHSAGCRRTNSSCRLPVVLARSDGSLRRMPEG